MNKSGNKKSDLCQEIHSLLARLPRYFEPHKKLCRNGIYFFYEQGELAHSNGNRIVRVGTHSAKRNLNHRLRNHYNGDREGGIFRKHLGTALLCRNDTSKREIKEWRKGRKSHVWSNFQKTENEIDVLLRSAFFFRIIQNGDESKKVSFSYLLRILVQSNKDLPISCGNSRYLRFVRRE